jgi:hypothetical protein
MDKPTVAVLYGLGEGPRIGQKLRSSLEAAGFNYTDDIQKANILLAHSGGALAIPADVTGKTILIVAPITGWEGPLIPTQVRKVRQDYRAAAASKHMKRWFAKSWHNTGYLIKYAPSYRALWRKAHQQRYALPLLKNCRVGILVFRDDPWSGYLGTYDFHYQLPYSFISFDRLHDDLWDNPQDYVSIIRYLYGM